jgi:hypothetical protein
MLNQKVAYAAFPYFAVLLIGIAWRITDTRRQQAIGAANLVISQTTAQRDTLRRQRDSLALRSVAAKETLRVAVIKRVPVRDSVDRWLTDTLRVPVPVEVVREIVRADSAVIEACTIALSTCDQEKAVLRQDLLLSQRQTAAYRVLIPSGFQTLKSNVVAGAAGALACWFLCPKR